MVKLYELFVEYLYVAHLFICLQTVVDIAEDLVEGLDLFLCLESLFQKQFLEILLLLLTFLHQKNRFLLFLQRPLELFFEFDQIYLKLLNLNFFRLHGFLHLSP